MCIYWFLTTYKKNDVLQIGIDRYIFIMILNFIKTVK